MHDIIYLVINVLFIMKLVILYRSTFCNISSLWNLLEVSFFTYLRDELKRDYLFQHNEKKLKERRKRVYTFVKTPKELEKVRKLMKVIQKIFE